MSKSTKQAKAAKQLHPAIKNVTFTPAAAPKAAKPKAKPTTATLPTGAANGAAEQPHTKQAIKEQRAREKAEFDAIKDKMVAEGKVFLLDTRRNVSAWYPAKGKWPVGALQIYPRHDAKPAKAKADPKPKGEKKPATPRVAANRAYSKGKTANTAKPGTWRHYMLETIMSAKDTDSAKAAHAKSGKFAGQALDFNWSAKQGYIAFKA